MKHKTNYLPEELIEFAFPSVYNSEIKIIGIGGGGCNAVNHMFLKNVQDVQFINCNTDEQALQNSPVPTKVQLGEKLTGGRGAGTNPDVGRAAAEESIDSILQLLAGNTEMVFVAAGMGGGTGTGAAPFIAAKIKEMGILTVGIVTMPFSNEIGFRRKNAEKGLEELSNSVDALVVIDNELLSSNYANYKLSEAFKEADEVLANAAESIVEIIKVHGQINVDFNDVKTVMTNSKLAMMGTGYAAGQNRAAEVVKNAIHSPLINYREMKNAKRILLNIISGQDEILMGEYDSICQQVQEIANHSSDQFIIGNAIDSKLGDKIKVTIIATGFEMPESKNHLSDRAKWSGAGKRMETDLPAPSDKKLYDLDEPIEEADKPKEEVKRKKTRDKKESLKQAKQFFIQFFDDLEE